MSDNLMESLFLTGKVVKLDCSVWSGRKKLRPEEIGFENGDLNRELINLGSKWLIPKEEIAALNKIRADAKREIESRSLKFSFGSFVPNEKMKTLNNRLAEIRTVFQEKMLDISTRYPELRQQMLNAWNAEAVSMAARKNNPDFVFEVMTRIEKALPQWHDISGKFSFDWNEYADMNQIARNFIEESTRGFLGKMVEFAESLKERINENNLSDRNLAPVRKYIDAMRESIKVFRNEQLVRILDDLDGWVMEGTGDEVKASSQIRGAMSSAMDSIITAGTEHVDEIARASIDAVTSHARQLELED
jgi:hypothetical protein